MSQKWYRLDTAALIFPAITKRDWCNVFRVSAELSEEIDPDVLQEAIRDLKSRFPSFYVSLHKGFFWYYLEESKEDVRVQKDFAYPLTFMSRKELHENCLRVFYYKNRMAVEVFHSVSDGRGGVIFLANLVARYIERKYGVEIPKGDLIRDFKEAPRAEELEDSFLKNAAEKASSRKEETAYRLHGTKDKSGFKHLTTGIVESKRLLDVSHEYGVTVTSFLAAVMAESILAMQAEERSRKRQKPVKITVPVDLRRLYHSKTLRNFTLVLNSGVDPRYGAYTFAELCSTIHHQLRANATPQNMAGMIAANVQPQQVVALRLAPVFLKNFVMKLVYNDSGERGGCINISNLGNLDLPEPMLTYVKRMEFIIGPQLRYPNNCSVLSCGGKTYINMIRIIQETELERQFFSRLVALGVPVEIESNGG
ncbi:MAG: hypothetical protein IJ744_05295 [Lachnospiraceae bacterium]|nr:hypothetical protein [Lachnospiraceae bacterium]